MRFLRIFFIYSQHVLQHRSTNVVWFLVSLYQPLILLLFWRVSYAQHGEILTGWTLSSVAAYYVLLIIAGSLLLVHVDEDAYEDIQMGDLAIYLLKPFSYFWMKFMSELPWRLIQGFYGVVTFVLLVSVFGIIIKLSLVPQGVLFFIVITTLGYFVSFTFKMLILLSAFWLTDTSAFRNLTELVLLIGAGFVMPLQFLPDAIRSIALGSPFAYMVYYPLTALLTQLTTIEYIRIIAMQLVWIALFALVYQWMWQIGVKKFSAIGR